MNQNDRPRRIRIKASYDDMSDERAPWRLIEISGVAPFSELHRVLQVAFGWGGTHGAHFEIVARGQRRNVIPSLPTVDLQGGPGMGAPAERIPVVAGFRNRLEPNGETRMKYFYDYGDRHSLTLELVAIEYGPEKKGDDDSVCLDGANRAPPDDIGGPLVWDALWAHFDGRAKVPAETLQKFKAWCGENATMQDFDADAVTAVLKGEVDNPDDDPICKNCGHVLNAPYDAPNQFFHLVPDPRMPGYGVVDFDGKLSGCTRPEPKR